MISISLSLEINKTVSLIKNSKRTFAFTGAGISVESGIPPFRGDEGIWNKYDPIFLDINFFKENPEKSWEISYKAFYEYFNKAKPNRAHQILATMEEKGLVDGIITQNIDSLHHQAGSKNVYEFHGNSRSLICMDCNKKIDFNKELLESIPPYCEKCSGVLKPDFVFFGEDIPEPARSMAFKEAENIDLLIIIGTTGEVQPASYIPYIANENGADIIEINIRPSLFTERITDIYLEGKASSIMEKLHLYL
ncbi:MAG: SIR2 family NAD-dependent protein deacylase [Halanaerobiales bacterium]